MPSWPAVNRSTDRRRAQRLEYATIAWNVGEAVFTVGLGIAAGSLALIGFGTDSVIEVFASAVVLWHVGGDDRVQRNRRALMLVGGAFAALAVVLSIAGLRDLVIGRLPGESPIGIIYLAITAVVMAGLAVAKRSLAIRLASAPLRSEANLTMLDAGLATLTLIGLGLNYWFGWWWADPTAALVVAAVAAREAFELWDEAREMDLVA